MASRDLVVFTLLLMTSSFIIYFQFHDGGLIGSLFSIVAIISLTFYGVWQRMAKKDCFSLAIEALKKNILRDYVTLEDAYKVVIQLNGEIKVKGSRDEVNGILRNYLQDHPAFLGVWAAYEPNTFDGKDASLGRMSSYFYRKEGKVMFMPLENLEAEDFYTRPMKTGSIEILDPFYYRIEGQDVLMTTIAAPLKRRGKVIGVIGVDVSLKEAKTIYRELIFFKNRFKQYGPAQLLKLLTKKGSTQLLGYAIDAGRKNQEEMGTLISLAASSLTESSHKITKRNHDLSQRVIEQASSLEEIASTIEELVSTINLNTNHALEATKVSRESEKKANEGGLVVQEAISAINDITTSSKRIEEIINVINDIAFQTNLLALNAAVEAARAQEHGRGFAVVAVEVRNLAQRSANAAKEIEDLIKETTLKVDKGTALANRSEDSIKMILKSINEVGRFIQEVASASKEQRQGALQINAAIGELDTLTQQNSSFVEKTLHESEEMANQAKELLGILEKYKVKR